MKRKEKILALAALAIVFGGAVASTPAEARWYDGHGWHRGHAPRGWAWDPRLGYYVAAPPPGVIVAQPAPGTIVVPPGTTVIQQQPQPQAVIVQQPAPVIVEQPAPPPVGVNLGVHIR